MIDNSNMIQNEAEAHFVSFILCGIAQYVDKIPTERTCLIAAVAHLARMVFCEQTPFDLKGQCNEIDGFCNVLKNYALRDAKRE